MKIINHLAIIVLAAVTLTACVNTPAIELPPPPTSMENCVPEEAAKLIGQTGLTASEIKNKTKSEIVRMVAPGQPVTMDYRENRITVTVDPESKLIVHASCG